MAAGFEVPIIIVGFGHSDDIVKCLKAVAIQRRCPKFEVFICENGGPAAYDALIETLTEKGAPCDGGVEPLDPASNEFVRACRLLLAGGAVGVTIGEARDNGGYAGGINAWVRPLLADPGWTAVWILNPDTWPEPDALAELVAYAAKRGKGMVGSRLMFPDRSDIASSRGPEMEQPHRQADRRRHLRSGVAGTRPRGRRTANGFSHRPVNVRHQKMHRADRAHGRILFSLLGGSRLGGPRQGHMRGRLRPQVGSSPRYGHDDRLSRESRQTVGLFGLSRPPKSASLRPPASSSLVSMDPVRVVRQNRGISGGRIDPQFRRRGSGSDRRPARRKRPPADGADPGALNSGAAAALSTASAAPR